MHSVAPPSSLSVQAVSSRAGPAVSEMEVAAPVFGKSLNTGAEVVAHNGVCYW